MNNSSFAPHDIWQRQGNGWTHDSAEWPQGVMYELLFLLHSRVLDKSNTRLGGFNLAHGIIGEAMVACNDGHVSVRWLAISHW